MYRVGRTPELWALPDFRFAAADRTFGNRYDDPLGEYRVRYVASQRLGCFLETLACFRPAPTLLAELSEIEEPDDHTPPGTIPRAWLASRLVGEAQVPGVFANVCETEWLAALRPRLRPELAGMGIRTLDSATMQSQARGLTQRVSRIVHDDAQGYAGIRYRSRLGHDIENLAIFDRREVAGSQEPIPLGDADLVASLQQLGLRLG